MFDWFSKSPGKKLQRAYEAKLSEAKDAEKYGDRARQAELYAEADALLQQLEALHATR